MREINLEEERQFENSKTVGRNPRAAQSKFYWAVDLSKDYHNQSLYKAIDGKDVLEIGCSTGFDAQTYIKYSKTYVGVDISNEAIKKAKGLKLPNAEFICVDGHSIPKSDKKFDAVIVISLLHHLDLATVFKEINRVLKKGGVLIFREPLGTNPIFQLYRNLTPSARTTDERPFTFNDIKLMKKYFILRDIQWFGFFSILSAFFLSPYLRLFLTKVDNVICLTPIKYLFWQFSGFAFKKND